MKRHGKIIWIAIAAFLAIFLIWIFLLRGFVKGKNNGYTTYKLGPKTIVKSVLTTGTTNPVNTISVGAQVSGEISKLYVWYNSLVKKGQLLAKIDPAPFMDKVKMDTATLESSEANVRKQEAQTRFDKLTYARDKKLWEENLIAHAVEQQAETTYLEDLNQENYLKSIVKSDSAQLNIDKTNLSYTNIYSPVNGIVINVNVAVGQTVASSFQTPTLFTIGENISKMEIDTTTNEADLAGIKKGDKVEFTVYAYPDKTFKGVVHNVRINPTVVSGVVSYNVVIHFDNVNNMILPGMTATPRIFTSTKTVPLAVPNGALRFMPQNISPGLKSSLTDRLKVGEGVIWLLENNKPVPVIVKLGDNNDTFTEVSSNELKAGYMVITGMGTQENGKASAQRRRFIF